MSWVRIKRWLAEHPAASAAVMMAACPVVVVWAGTAWGQAGGSDGVLFTVLVDALCGAALGAATFWLTVVRVRAGLTVRAVMKTLAQGFVAGLIVWPVINMGQSMSADAQRDSLWLLSPRAGIEALRAAALMLWPLAAAGMGMGMAESRAARKLLAGRWETTQPLVDDDEGEP